MTENPFQATYAPADAAETTAPPNPLLLWLGRVGFAGLVVFTCLYLAVLVVSPRGEITLTGMLGITSGNIIFLFKLIYTALLAACCLAYLLRKPLAALVAALAVVLATAGPLMYSLVSDFRPHFYELYVGEALTIAAALMVAAACWPWRSNAFAGTGQGDVVIGQHESK